ncbi:hypothetical protein RB195_020435 [Necator americanus]|uniref:Uncharacterized protein n=1 Tax=Necator americanus TaxID=51031 RepID=A0ABR1CK64_NECAM
MSSTRTSFVLIRERFGSGGTRMCRSVYWNGAMFNDAMNGLRRGEERETKKKKNDESYVEENPSSKKVIVLHVLVGDGPRLLVDKPPPPMRRFIKLRPVYSDKIAALIDTD